MSPPFQLGARVVSLMRRYAWRAMSLPSWVRFLGVSRRGIYLVDVGNLL
jgi:hypothetical protein